MGTTAAKFGDDYAIAWEIDRETDLSSVATVMTRHDLEWQYRAKFTPPLTRAERVEIESVGMESELMKTAMEKRQ